MYTLELIVFVVIEAATLIACCAAGTNTLHTFKQLASFFSGRGGEGGGGGGVVCYSF